MKYILFFIIIYFQPALFAQTFREVKAPAKFVDINRGSVSFLDVDGDADPDVLVTGLTESESVVSRLYKNDGNGQFMDDPNPPFLPVFDSAIAAADIDNDNDQDILVTGYSAAGDRATTLYINDGSGKFTAAPSTPLAEICCGNAAFSDVDGDNDPDVFISGENNTASPLARLYLNNGSGQFSEAPGNTFLGLYSSKSIFGDVDGDNDPDLLHLGQAFNTSMVSVLYLNDGTGIFMPVQDNNIAALTQGDAAFADIEGDSDLDVLISGKTASGIPKTVLYTNDGAGHFEMVQGAPFVGVHNSTVSFSDLDGDNDQDVLITGNNSLNKYTAVLYNNQGSGLFEAESHPSFEGIAGGSVAFSDVDGDNDVDILMAGSISNNYNITNLYSNEGAGVYGLRNTFTGAGHSTSAFADIDGDGDQDVMVSGVSPKGLRSYLYKNDGIGNFIRISNSNLKYIIYGTGILSDVDGDNDQDLLMAGTNQFFNLNASLYLNDGSGQFSESPDSMFGGVTWADAAFADVDGDMDQDVLITGFGPSASSKLYLNDGAGYFTQATNTQLERVSNSAVAFGDIDGDNDQDLLISGLNQLSQYVTKLYTNDGAGHFAPSTGNSFLGIKDGTAQFVDIDGDEDLDIFLAGSINNNSFARIYTNNGAGIFTQMQGTTIEGYAYCAADFADIDGDNDPDLLISGRDSDLHSNSKLYLNDGAGQFTLLENTPFVSLFAGTIDFMDVDGDNDPDVLITGADDNHDETTRLYINETIVAVKESPSDAPESQLIVYPNPAAANQINIDFPSISNKRIEITILDFQGRVIQRQVTEIRATQTLSINVSRLPKGSYIVRANDEMSTMAKVFVIE